MTCVNFLNCTSLPCIVECAGGWVGKKERKELHSAAAARAAVFGSRSRLLLWIRMRSVSLCIPHYFSHSWVSCHVESGCFWLGLRRELSDRFELTQVYSHSLKLAISWEVELREIICVLYKLSKVFFDFLDRRYELRMKFNLHLAVRPNYQSKITRRFWLILIMSKLRKELMNKPYQDIGGKTDESW